MTIVIALFDCESNIFRFVHKSNPLSDIPHNPLAYSISMDFAKGWHVVILLLLHASKVCIFVHKSNPMSDIPHDPVACNILMDFAKG